MRQPPTTSGGDSGALRARVIVEARVSKSGNAIAQSGDLQAVSKPMAVTTTAPIELTIDQVVP